MKWPELIAAMDGKAEQTMAQLEEANVFQLRLSRGELREAVIAVAIRPWLPERYGLGSGEVVGADGKPQQRFGHTDLRRPLLGRVQERRRKAAVSGGVRVRHHRGQDHAERG